MSRGKIVLKVILFFCIVFIIFNALGSLAHPDWRASWNNYNTIHGFYEQPKNTIEVVFLGTSMTVNAYTPMELYENYGICAYNLGTEQQPMLASYYWLEEAYRLHSESLKVVVVDPSGLRRDASDSFYRKALDEMRFSSVKLHALKDYLGDFSKIPSYLFSLLSYHDRWSSLGKADFQKVGYEPDTYTRGYHFVSTQYLDTDNYDKLSVPNYYPNETAEKATLNENGSYYAEKIMDFCEEHSLKLVWAMAPRAEWSAGWHNAVAEFLEQRDMEYYALYYLPYFDELGYNAAMDYADRYGHANYYGASKVTNWIGKYLSEECDVTDVRGDEKYAFLEDELKAYQANIKGAAAIKKASDPAEYISIAAQMPDCMVFLAVKDEAANSLTKQQRDAFAQMGLSKLSTLTYRDSYLAVLDEGTVITELADVWKDGDNQREAISANGTFGEMIQYTITSGGFAFGNKASIVIGGSEKAKNTRGINIVVYNYKREEVVDATAFDTYASSVRIGDVPAELAKKLEEGVPYTDLSGDLEKLYLFNRRCENAKLAGYLNLEIGEDGLWDFLTSFEDKADYTIMISVCDDAAGSFDPHVRNAFAEIGLKDLAKLEAGDSYVAVIESGIVKYEQRDHGEEPIAAEGSNYKIVSGGAASGNMASIQVNGKEYAKNTRGINIVVFDKQLKTVITQTVFDTSAVAVSMP